MSLFRGPNDKNYDVLLAENDLINNVQLAIEAAMKAQDITQADLAKRLGISEARVSQMLADNGSNLRARTIARIACALDRRAKIEFREVIARPKCWNIKLSEGRFGRWVETAHNPDDRASESSQACNDDEISAAA